MTVSDNGTPMMFGGDGFGGGGFIWTFLIFALLIMGNGGFFGGGNGNANALQADMQRGFDNQNSMANQREILSATNGVYHDINATLVDKYSELARDINAVGAGVSQAIANQCQLNGDLKLQIAETGSGINANIAQSRFDSAMNTAAVNATTTAIGQKILDKLNESENRALQNRVNQLELNNALAGVVRYQPNMTFGSMPSPFFGGNGGYPVYA